MEKNTEALPYYQESLDGSRRILGDDHRDTLTSISNMAYLLLKLGENEDAFEMLHAGEADARRTWTRPNIRWLANYLTKLGESEGATRRFAQGEETLLEVYKLLVEGFSDDHERISECVQQLVTLYEAWHEATQNDDYNTKAAEWRMKRPRLKSEE